MKKTAKEFWESLFQTDVLTTEIRAISENKDGRILSTLTEGDVHLQCQSASPIGDHYLSDVFFLKATILSSGIQYHGFCKILPSNKGLREMVLSMGLNETEVGIYCTLFPNLYEIRKESGLTENDLPFNVPEMYCSKIIQQNRYYSVIVLEDLAVHGFRLVNKVIGCPWQETQLALNSLANFHALSIAYLRKSGIHRDHSKIPQNLTFLTDTEMRKKFDWDFINTQMESHVQHLKMIGHTKAVEFIEESRNHLLDVLVYETIEDCGPIGCILHGDFWVNNLMFRYDPNDETKPIEMKIIDWQVSLLGHPSRDVIFYLLTSVDVSLREKYFRSLLTDYYEALKTALLKFGIDLLQENYTEETFLLDVKKKLRWGMLYTIVLLPLMIDFRVASNYRCNLTEADPEIHFRKGEFSNETVDEMKQIMNATIMADVL